MRKIIILACIIFTVNLSAQTTDWVKACGGPNSDKGISIGTDSLGFIYISGFFNGEADFGPYTLYASYANNKNIFVAKMDSLGNFLWAVAGTGGPYDDRALGMHVTPGGDVFLTGTFWDYIEFPSASGPVSLSGNGCDTSPLIKIDSDGNCVFVIQVCNGTGSGSCPWPIYDCDDHSYDVKVDNDGFIYVTGFYSTYSADFGPFTLNNPNWADCQPAGYIGKWDATGNIIWVEGFDGIKDQRGSRDNRLAIDEFSNIYLCGGFQNTGIFGPFSLTSNGEWDAFIFKMDTDGNWLWAKNIGSNKTDRANSIAVDICNDIYITGEYRNPMVFPGANASNGTDTLSHKQKRDVFVAKMNNQGDWKWAKRARSEGTDKPYQMSVDANKQVFVGGTARGELTFSNGLVVGPQIPGDTTASAWVAQLDGSSNNGDWVWAKTAGADTDDDDRTGDICPDGFGNVYAIGFYEDAADFDGTTLTSLGRKDVFVWKMSMTTMPPFTNNNTFETIYADSMVFNPADTGIFTNSGLIVDGCDTTFVDSIVHQKLGARVVFTINDLSTSTTITVDGTVLSVFPASIDYYLDVNVTISSAIDPLYGFISWSSNNIIISPNNMSQIASFDVTSSDTIRLNIYKKPTIVYDVVPGGTTTTIDINAITTSIFPYSETYFNDEIITLSANIDADYYFVGWQYDSITMLNGNSLVNSFVSEHNDVVKLITELKPPLQAFISGNDSICSNSINQAEVKISFSAGIEPYTFVYAINGVNQPSSLTTINPYIIYTSNPGIYTLTSFSDANEIGYTSGSAIVTIKEAPEALFITLTDTLSFLYPSLQLNDISDGNIVTWDWDFGDNTSNEFIHNPYHTYKDSIGIYQISMIVTDDLGCSDTARKQIWIADEYWMYIPNAFTPDHDGVNDVFCLQHHGVREETFNFNIYDRFSNLVYATDKIEKLECFLNSNGWNGTHYKTGNDLPMGTYIYEVYFQDFEGWKHQEQGHLFIVR
jgi:gliding motility-associated-like protein